MSDVQATYILARFSAVQKAWERNYTLEIYMDDLPVNYITAQVHIIYEIITMARLLHCPIKLWCHNPPEMDRAIREYAREYGVTILED